MGVFGGPNLSEDGLVLALDGANYKSFKGESVTNLYYVSSGASANTSIFSMPMGGTATGSYTTSHSYGSWSGNTIFKVTVSSGTLGGYESFRSCVSASFDSTYGTTRRVSAKVKMLKGSITSLGYHNGGGTGGHISSHYTSISESSVPTDVLSKDGWYQFDIDVSGSYPSGHCVGIGIVGSDIEFLVTEMMLYPSSTFVRFTPTTRGTTVATGGGWADLIGNGNNGELVNGVREDSANGGSLVFDGSNQRVSTNFKPSGARSYFIWVKFSSLTHASGYQLTGTQEGNAYTYIGIQNGGNVYYYAGAATGGDIGNPVTVNTWVNLGFALFPDGSRRVYKNGIEIHYNTGGLGGTATAEFSVGCINQNHFITGNIAQVSIYNRALSAAEIQQNFNALRGRFGI